jgi:predicted dehydrogenase
MKHELVVENKITGIRTSETHFNGGKYGPRSEMYWTSYRYQLEAFVAKVRGEEPPHWVDLDESIATMELVDAVYEKAGLPKRGLDLS